MTRIRTHDDRLVTVEGMDDVVSLVIEGAVLPRIYAAATLTRAQAIRLATTLLSASYPDATAPEPTPGGDR